MDSSTTPNDWTDAPGTIDDLIADAKARGFPATARLVHDWVALGLIDRPLRRSRGAQRGSDKAVWPANQRNLFRALVDKRPQVKEIAPLCNIPVFIWLRWGEEQVPTRQAQRALATWAGKAEAVSWQTARNQARQVVESLDDMSASKAQRESLVNALAKTGYSRQLDKQALTEAVLEVFDPNREGRAFGSSLMPMTAERYVELIETRMLGMGVARQPAPMAELQNAWSICRWGIERYYADRPRLASTSIRPQDMHLWDVPTMNDLANKACSQVALVLGGLAWQARQTAASR